MSNANKMDEIAGIFGLELGEQFNIVSRGEYSTFNPHRFTEEGLIDKDGDGTALLNNLMLGRYTIEKLPFRPKVGQRYYTCGAGLIVLDLNWVGCSYDLERQLLGIVFRTEQEAIEYLPIYEKRLKGEEVY